MIWRHPDAVLNEPEPSDSELNSCFLKALRECPSRLRPFPKPLLVLLGYVNVLNVKGFTKTAAPKTSTRRSIRHMLKGVPQSTSSDPVDLSEDIEVSEDQQIDVNVEKKKELIVVGKKKKSGAKKVLAASIQGSSGKSVESLEEPNANEVYIPNWGVKVGDNFKDSSICEAWVKKVSELTRRHEVEMEGLKKRMEVDKLQLKADKEALDVQKKAFAEEKEGLKALVAWATSDNKWLIEHGFQQVVTYLLHSTEFNSAFGDVYMKLLNHGKHMGFVAGYKAHESGQPQDQSPLFRPKASKIFKESVYKMEMLTYPYVCEVSSCFGKPISVLQGLKPDGLNEKVCFEVLESLSKKRSCSGDSEETFSDDADGSKEASCNIPKISKFKIKLLHE
ncbi:hypothetical protein Hanom_Chr08g00733141 [Helianthus anomalus]